MTNLTYVAVALIAAAAYSAQASAANGNAAARRAHASMTTQAGSMTGDCVRAPNVGSYAGAPYAEPPCQPGTAK